VITQSFTAVLGALLVPCLLGVPLARAQASPDFSGTWTLDRARTDPALLPRSESAGAAFSGGGASDRLVIRQTPAELSVTPGTAAAIVYKLDGNATWYPSLEATARWEQQTLVITWTRNNVYLGPGKGYATYKGTDVYSISGDTLTMERATTTQQGMQKGKLVYTRS